MLHEEFPLNTNEETEISWINGLKEFDEEVWPIFQRRGYSKGDAMMLYQMQGIKNALYTIQEILQEGSITGEDDG